MYEKRAHNPRQVQSIHEHIIMMRIQIDSWLLLILLSLSKAKGGNAYEDYPFIAFPKHVGSRSIGLYCRPLIILSA